MFAGFEPPTSNYFRMPNCWTDITAEINNLAELKVIQYVLRHTWGYQEFGEAKSITVDEFMHGRKYTRGERAGQRMDKGTGLKSDRSVKDGIKLAVEHGYLVCEIDDSDLARIKKSYKLNMQGGTQHLPTRGVESTPQGRGVDSTPQSGRIYPSGSQNLPLGPVKSTPRSEERNSRKTREKEREVPPTNQQPKDVSLSLSLEKSSQEEASIPMQQNGSINATLASLTEEESALWARWCHVSKAYPESLNPNGHKYVKFFAEKALTTEEVQSLYEATYARICEYAKAGGTEPLPPRLGNLYKAFPEWEKTREKRKQEERESQEEREFIPGTGGIRNFTTLRLRGQVQQPLNYVPPKTERRDRSSLTPVGEVTFTDQLAALRKRIKGSDNGDSSA